MTCIVGLVDKGKVYLGGDSAGVRADLQIMVRKDPKVFKVEKFVIGFSSSFRMGQLLMKSLKPPKISPKDKKDLYKYMTTKFVDEIRRVFKAGGYLEVKAGVEVGGNFLVGIEGHLFHIQPDFQVSETYEPYTAIGCGEQYALTALHILTSFPTTKKLTPQQKLEFALGAASKFSGGVRPPYNHVNT
jgi:ATP-dependent protease HslVU (ClpYQ) peptidase subunit